MSLVPAPFLFRYSIPVSRIERLPRAQAPLLKLPATAEIPFPSSMENERTFATLRMAWNPHGLAVSVTVTGKSDWPVCSPESIQNSDGVQLWLDTRNTQNIHRASRYCHHFVLLPIGEGTDGMTPVIKQLPVPRAGEDAPEVDDEHILLESAADTSGYTVAAWFPQESLYGFDPDSYPRLGFYICVRDAELGNQCFTVGDDFPYQSDPSLWVSLNLSDTEAEA